MADAMISGINVWNVRIPSNWIPTFLENICGQRPGQNNILAGKNVHGKSRSRREEGPQVQKMLILSFMHHFLT